MMKIKCISSGSKGNAYLVSDGHSQILLDCGVTFKQLQVATNFKTSKLSACLITHEHKDHSKCAKDLCLRGVPIIATQGTLEAIGLDGIKPTPVEKQFIQDSFFILPFSIEHDAVDPVGFIIFSTVTRENLLYVTDTCYVKYNLSKYEFDYILIEANHDKELIIDNVLNKKLHPDLAKRILKNHMSIDTCIAMLNTMNLRCTKEIDLIHLSDSNSNAKEFKEKVQRATGCVVNVF